MPAQYHRLRLLVGVAATLATSVCTQEEAPYPVVPGETGPPLAAPGGEVIYASRPSRPVYFFNASL